MVANGRSVAGEVINSVLFPGVIVAPGTLVRNSIVVHDAMVGANSVRDRATARASMSR